MAAPPDTICAPPRRTWRRAHLYLRHRTRSAHPHAGLGGWRTYTYATGHDLRTPTQDLADGAPIPTPPDTICTLLRKTCPGAQV